MKITFQNSPSPKTELELTVVPVRGAVPPKSGKGASSTSKDKKKKARDKVRSWTAEFDKRSVALLEKLDRSTNGIVQATVKRHKFSPKEGKRLEVTLTSKSGTEIRRLRLSTITASPKAPLSSELDQWRKLGGDAFHTARRLRAEKLAVWIDESGNDLTQFAEAVVEGVQLGSYTYLKYKQPPKARNKKAVANDRYELKEIRFYGPGSKKPQGFDSAVQRALIRSRATAFARDLVNTPPNDLIPADLVRVSREVARRSCRGGRVTVKAFGRNALKRMGAGTLLAVANGSDAEPFLIHMSYQPRTSTKNKRRVVIVGKGVTFDTGGLWIKSAKGMEEEKRDMSGAACCIAVMKALTELPAGVINHEVHILAPTAENMINGSCMRPGDVAYAMNGKSVEIVNTDAEGRLVLADALSYAEHLKPDLIIDLATLTGACVVALGSDYAGMFTRSETLATSLSIHGAQTGEKLWRLPLASDYSSLLDSPIANMKNFSAGSPAAIFAALFLEEFVPEGVPWVHLDIAGPAYVSKSNEYISPGGTGFGVRTLLRFLEALDQVEI